MKATKTRMGGVAAMLIAIGAALAVPAGESVSLTGEGKCAKCALKEGDKCQTVIQSSKDGKMITYYLAANDTAKDWHGKVCKETKTLRVTGMIREQDGKVWLTATKIEPAAN